MDIGLVTWNTRDELSAALASIRAHGPGRRVVVVDNASTDGTAEMVARDFPEVELVRERRNRGFAAGANRVLERTAGSDVLLLNADVELRSGAVERLEAALAARPRAAAVGPRLVGEDGRAQHSAHRLPSLRLAAWVNSGLWRLRPPTWRGDMLLEWAPPPTTATRVGWVVGAAMALRRAVVEEIGGFDESFFMYAEDLEWCHRATDAGWEVWHEPEAVVVHLGDRSGRQAYPGRRTQAWLESTYRFAGRAHGPAWTAAFYALNAAGSAARYGWTRLRRPAGDRPDADRKRWRAYVDYHLGLERPLSGEAGARRRERILAAARVVVPLSLVAATASARRRRRHGAVPALALAMLWTTTYRRHRRWAAAADQEQRERLRGTDARALRRHLGERGEGPPGGSAPDREVTAAVREAVSRASVVLHAGCGEGLLAEHVPAGVGFVGLDVSEPRVQAARKLRGGPARGWIRGDAERLPLRSGSADVVVCTCLHRSLGPDRILWEAARVLRPGGRLELSVPNACAAPGRSPLSHPLVWMERALAATNPWLLPGRSWIAPAPARADDAADGLSVPEIHHVAGELGWLLREAGFRRIRWTTHGGAAAGPLGRRLARRLGARLLVEARHDAEPVSAVPPLGAWRGLEG